MIVVRNARSRILIVLVAVLLGIGALWVTLPSSSGTGLSINSANVVLSKHFSLHLEQIGGCPEAQLDGGRDVDPGGYRDVEDDECVPGQHRARAPDGVPLDSKGYVG